MATATSASATALATIASSAHLLCRSLCRVTHRLKTIGGILEARHDGDMGAHENSWACYIIMSIDEKLVIAQAMALLFMSMIYSEPEARRRRREVAHRHFGCRATTAYRHIGGDLHRAAWRHFSLAKGAPVSRHESSGSAACQQGLSYIIAFSMWRRGLFFSWRRTPVNRKSGGGNQCGCIFFFSSSICKAT